MIGRKLTDRLAQGRSPGRTAITALDLHDIVPPQAEPPWHRRLLPISATSPTGAAARWCRRKPDIVFHLAGIVSGEAEANFELGYRVNLDGTRAPVRRRETGRLTGRASSSRRRSRSSARRFPDVIPDDFQQTPLTSYGTQKLIGEAAPGRLYAARLLRRRRHPAADDLRASGQAEQGGLELLFRHHPRAAGRRRRQSCRCRARVVHTHASPRSAVNFLIHAAGHRRRRDRPASQPHHARCRRHRRRADRGAGARRRRRMSSS